MSKVYHFGLHSGGIRWGLLDEIVQDYLLH